MKDQFSMKFLPWLLLCCSKATFTFTLLKVAFIKYGSLGGGTFLELR